jgi:PAS domain S-box-containing protein
MRNGEDILTPAVSRFLSAGSPHGRRENILMSASLPLHDEQERLAFQARLVEIVEQSVIATGLEGKITFWNRYAEKLFVWSAAEVTNRQVSEILVPAAARGVGEEIVKKVLASEVWAGEFVVQRREWQHFSSPPDGDPRGRRLRHWHRRSRARHHRALAG